MNLVDGVLVVVVLLSAWGGWRRGLLVSGADLLALAASLVWALWAYPRGVALAEAWGWRAGVWSAPLAFLASYLLARLLLGIVLGRLLAAVPPPAHGHGLNRFLGLVPGTANGLIHAAILALLLMALPIDDRVTRETGDSAMAQTLAEPAEWLEARLGPIFQPAVEKTLSRLTVQPGSRESVALPFSVADPKSRPELEARLLDLVNSERRAAGLGALQADPAAAEVARAHSRDMFARSYFSHITPEGKDPFDRLRSGGVRYWLAGENLALARTVPMAHQGLMNSPGHRANILRPDFGRVGIGIADGGRHGLMVTQNFRN